MAKQKLTVDELFYGSNSNNKVGTIESVLAGIGSGLISIPKGFFSLGATLMDLGVDEGRAAKVEQFFDDLTTLDEKAEATTAGQITEALVNIGLPGGAGFKIGSKLAADAMRASRNAKYFKPTKTVKGLQDEVLNLNLKGKTNRFIGGAIGGGIAEATFVGDVEKIGTFGDLIGGPTEIDRATEGDPVKDLINRVKFGTEGALFTGLIGGTGRVIKKLTDRNKQLDVANSKLDRFIDKIASGFRARSGKTQEFFDIERTNIGERASDAVKAKNVSRELEKNIDKVFPLFRTIGNRTNQQGRDALLKDINDLLLSGEAKIDDLGVAKFGGLEQAKKEALLKKLKDLKVDDDTIGNIFGSLMEIRDRWAELFSNLGRTLGKNEIAEFKKLFGNKFKNYIGATYDVFQNKSILPFMNYTPTRQAIDRAKQVFKESAEEAGKPITDLQAEEIVANALKDPKLPKGFRLDRPSDVIFQAPDFFVNRTTLDETLTRRTNQPLVSIGELAAKGDADPIRNPTAATKELRKVFDDLFGKQKNPMQTVIGATAKLSMLTRRNQFYKNLAQKNDELAEAYFNGTSQVKPFLARSEAEARQLFGTDFRPVAVIDRAQKLAVDAGKGVKKETRAEMLSRVGDSAAATNPFAEGQFFARPGVAKALEDTGLQQVAPGMIGQLYQSLVLYPKGLSQIAKTILSPVTHMRNFVSASFFATANGIIPDQAAIKQAYQALQTPLKGTRQQNDLYEELLKLGVVNNNVRLGDLTRLLEDVNFGETMTADKGFRLLLKPLSKIKAVSQDLYTAEDDFWKIASWAMEKSRLEKTLTNAGLTRGKTFIRNGVEEVFDDNFLKREAADIVKNNIPNYDYVSDFVKSLRKLPIGNFVSFPAEIVRTGTNIVRRALREINEEIIVDGKTIKPFEGIGYTRLFGFGATTIAVPAATAEAFAAIYDVTDEEREALRRYVADWSKNSTLLPIKEKDGTFKYIDFSHANAYDTLVRPIQTIINSVADGEKDEDGLMNDFIAGTFASMSEFAQPFISESIWTEAVADIIARGGRTRDGFQVFNEQDTPGDKAYKIMGHLVEAQMPFSFNQLKRLDRSLESVNILTKGKFDEYGQAYEFGDEFAGLFGFRSVNVNPDRTLNFKVANYQRGVRESRSLFTREALRGGPIEPRDIVDSYINANRALFDVRKEFKLDLEAAETLGISRAGYNNATDRLSRVDVRTIRNNIFRPIEISDEIASAFARNAARIGEVNPLVPARAAIGSISSQLRATSLLEPNFPFIENPLLPSAQETPVTPNTLNLPSIDSNLISNTVNNNNLSNLSTAQKLAILFGRD